MAALSFVVGRLADVVQQAAAAGQLAVKSHHLGQHAGEEGHFDAVPQHVLAVAGAEMEPAEQVRPAARAARGRRLPGRLLARLLDVPLQLLLRLGDESPRSAWDGCGRRRSACSSDSRATSRRIVSKPLTITTPGVSSMITSTPVAFSKARMFRPSRPMIRPFISSLGMSTVLVVVSAVWAAA